MTGWFWLTEGGTAVVVELLEHTKRYMRPGRYDAFIDFRVPAVVNGSRQTYAVQCMHPTGTSWTP